MHSHTTRATYGGIDVLELQCLGPLEGNGGQLGAELLNLIIKAKNSDGSLVPVPVFPEYKVFEASMT